MGNVHDEEEYPFFQIEDVGHGHGKDVHCGSDGTNHLLYSCGEVDNVQDALDHFGQDLVRVEFA